MRSSLPAFAPPALLLAALLLAAAPPALAQAAQASTPSARAPAAPQPWLYEGSDVPVDTSWTFGTLDNGLRYAVKRNGVPPGQVSIRIRIDAGTLHERDDEQGFAHLIEHLSFRGSTFVPEGESKRIWQRYGVNFGSDANALTTPTQTVYKLDLPAATPATLDESFKILSGMMQAPSITEASVAAERQIVLAELRESSGPQVTLADATLGLFFQGQRLGRFPRSASLATLAKATPEALIAFHRRWYRPENMVIAAAGDVDPATLEALIKNHFADWRGAGEASAAPPFGDPQRNGPTTRIVVEPTLPATLTMMVARPWRQKPDTIAYNEGILRDLLALQLINRRLEAKARAGGSYLEASVTQETISRSADATLVSIVPLGGDWRAALRDVRAVIADARTTAPSAEEIARELAEFTNQFRIGVDSYPFEQAGNQADDIVQAVDIREAVATPMIALQVLEGAAPGFTPDAMLKATQGLLEGDVTRLLMASPERVKGGEVALAAALAAPVTAATGARVAIRAIDSSALPPLGPPGTVSRVDTIAWLGMEQVEFANGVRVLLFPNPAEEKKIKLLVRFGRGYAGMTPAEGRLAWSGGFALSQSGIGALGQEELDQLTTGRRVAMDFAIDDDAFQFSADTRPEDLDLQLRLIATKLAAPRWDARPVERAKAAVQAIYPSYETGADNVLQRDLLYLLRGRDPRWKTPGPAEAARLTPASFKALWAPKLASGPIEILLFGDFEREAAVKLLTETFGALAPRPAPPIDAATATPAFARTAGAPMKITHRGPADQGAVAVAWPTGAGVPGLRQSRQLELLAAIFRDRLFETFRTVEAASYSPYVYSNWPVGLGSGGYVVAVSQVQPDNIAGFSERARTIAADLAARPVSADELARAVEPMRQLITRVSTANAFWQLQLKGVTTDPSRFAMLRTLLSDYVQTRPADIQQLAATYLTPDRAVTVEVRPQR